MEPVAYRYRGFLLARERIAPLAGTWWSRVRLATGTGLLMATDEPPSVWRECGHSMFGAAEIADYMDEPRGICRVAAFVDGRLSGCLFIGPANAGPQWDTVKALFEAEALGEMQRRAVLSGKSTDGLANPGPLVCACFGVGLNVIRAAITSGQAANVDEIGTALRAGTNCGSCLPDLKRHRRHGRIAQTA